MCVMGWLKRDNQYNLYFITPLQYLITCYSGGCMRVIHIYIVHRLTPSVDFLLITSSKEIGKIIGSILSGTPTRNTRKPLTEVLLCFLILSHLLFQGSVPTIRPFIIRRLTTTSTAALDGAHTNKCGLGALSLLPGITLLGTDAVDL